MILRCKATLGQENPQLKQNNNKQSPNVDSGLIVQSVDLQSIGREIGKETESVMTGKKL